MMHLLQLGKASTEIQEPSHNPPGNSLHEHYFGHEHVTLIEPVDGWRLLDLKEIWAYRELFWVLTARDVKVRYKQTVLGAGWAIIQPFMTMVVFSIIFGGFARCPPTGSLTPFCLCGSAALDLLCKLPLAFRLLCSRLGPSHK